MLHDAHAHHNCAGMASIDIINMSGFSWDVLIFFMIVCSTRMLFFPEIIIFKFIVLSIGFNNIVNLFLPGFIACWRLVDEWGLSLVANLPGPKVDYFKISRIKLMRSSFSNFIILTIHFEFNVMKI